VYPLPIGRGQRLLSDVNGAVDKLVGGWVINGLTTFQDGFPIAFADSSANTLESNFVQGGGIVGEGVGVSRPNYVPNATAANDPTFDTNYPACNGNPRLPGKPSQRQGAWFNPNCYEAPGQFEFGNEPRADPNLRGQGIDSTDFSIAKDIAIRERYRVDIRAEFFNLFNWTQFAMPNTQADQLGTNDSLGDNQGPFGVVFGQANQPRLIQFSGRFSF
jgi:hypothetical protein